MTIATIQRHATSCTLTIDDLGGDTIILTGDGTNSGAEYRGVRSIPRLSPMAEWCHRLDEAGLLEEFTYTNQDLSFCYISLRHVKDAAIKVTDLARECAGDPRLGRTQITVLADVPATTGIEDDTDSGAKLRTTCERLLLAAVNKLLA